MNPTKTVLLLFLLMNIANCITVKCRDGGIRTYCSGGGRGRACTATCSSNGKRVLSCKNGRISSSCTNGLCDVQCGSGSGKQIKFKPGFSFFGSKNPFFNL